MWRLVITSATNNTQRLLLYFAHLINLNIDTLVLFIANCTCTDIISDKTAKGNCTHPWKNEQGEDLLWCYVNQPSNCTDQINSNSYPGEIWSVVACQERIGKPGVGLLEPYNV